MSSARGIDIERFVNGEMELHFRCITLTQKNSQEPILFVGPGRVYLDNGELRFCLYHTNVSDESARHMRMALSGRAGEVVREDSYFLFEGTDAWGRIWTSDSVDLHGGSYHSQLSIVEGSTFSLKSTITSESMGREMLHQVYLPNIDFPFPHYEIPSGIDFESGGLIFSLRKHEDICDVTVTGSELRDTLQDAIHSMLNVLAGIHFQVALVEKIGKGNSTFTIFSRNNDASNFKMPPPIGMPYQLPSRFFERVFNVFLPFFEEEGNVFYGNWNKLNRAWQNGIESTALSVSVCIEGILKTYFNALGEDLEFKELCQKAKPALKGLGIDERVKSILQSSLGNAGHFKPKTALHKLTESGLISPGLATKWNVLRSQTAHAVSLGQSLEDQQRLVNLVYANFKLFYQIFFAIIDYDGDRIDYEEQGHPSGPRRDLESLGAKK